MARALSPHRSKLALLAVIAIIVAITASRSSVFFTTNNLVNILSQVSVLGILACGTTLLMVSGGLDLSIGANVSFSGMVLADLMIHGWSVTAALAAGMAVAGLVGVVNGILAAFSKSHPFVVTLGSMIALQGAALLVSQTPLFGMPTGFVTFSSHTALGLPAIVWAFLLVAACTQVVLAKTTFGRRLYAIGGSQTAAQLSGVRVRGVKVVAYTVMGLLAGVAAILLVSQIASADASMGNGMELAAIAAVAVGGTPLAGGRGDIVGTLLGVLLLGIISNSLNLMSISPNVQYLLQGLVIVIAVMAQRGE